jgi:iron complex outermembrane receptor protein
MRHSFLIFLLSPFCTAMALHAVGQSPTSTLSGTIYNKGSGQTIPGAEVYFPDLRIGAVTDIDGHFEVRGLPRTKELVKVSMVGYATITQTVDLSQETVHDFKLSESVTEMNEVVVTGASKSTELKRDPVPTVLVGRRELRESPSTTAIGALANVPGISVVSTGPNIAKPYIRGLGGSRVLTLFDGVRQEGQQWGSEHGVEVDRFLIDRVEVVKGPASLMYGSDALAGVVNLLPARPVAAGILKGALLAEYATNNNGLAGSLNLDGNNGRMIYGGRASAKVAADYQNPVDGRVYGTKYDEKDLDAYWGVNRSWGFAHVNLSAYDNLQEVPDGSRDSLTRKFTQPLDEAGDVQAIVDEASMRNYRISNIHQHVQFYRAYGTGSVAVGKGRITAKVGLERSIRREYSHPTAPGIPGLYLRLTSIPYDAKFLFADRGGWETSAGLNGMFQWNDASNGTELLVPNYHQLDLGPFILAKKTMGNVDVSGGLRYDARKFSSDAMYTHQDPSTGFELVTTSPTNDSTSVRQLDHHGRTFSGVSGSIGMAWNINGQWTVKANLGRGYRAPNVAELASKGEHPGTGTVQLGNADLRPEFNVQEDLGLFYAGTHVSASAEFFHNRISNYIYDGKLGSGDPLAEIGPDVNDALPVFLYTQTKARLYGGEFSIDIHPHPLDQLHFKNSLSVVLGENLGNGELQPTDSTRYLPLIPPLHTNSELRYDFRKKLGCIENLFVNLSVQAYAAQNRYYSAFGTETATPGYALLDAGLGGDVKGKTGKTLFSFTLLGTNLTDAAWQSNMDRLKYMEDRPMNGTGRSGIYGMGRNIVLRVTVPFGLKGGQPN